MLRTLLFKILSWESQKMVPDQKQERRNNNYINLVEEGQIL